MLDLFSLGNEPSDTKKKVNTGPISQKMLLEGLQELENHDEEYQEMGADAVGFAESLRR